jgi:hypothetical protein
VCNRARNEHFACVQQAAKLNFAAVALTTAVKVSHFYIYLLSQLQHIYLHISGVILQNLDWLQLKFDFVSGTATISTEFSSGLKFPPISNEAAAYHISAAACKEYRLIGRGHKLAYGRGKLKR